MGVFRSFRTILLGLLILLGGLVFTAQASSMVTYRGEIDYQGEDSCRGMVLLWSAEKVAAPAAETFNLVPDWVEELDAECRFEIQVPSGSYFLQAVVRQTPGPAMGPLRFGDLLFTSAEQRQISANAGEQMHLGTLATQSVFNGYPEQVETGISGRLIDEKGMPIAGLRVLAYLDKSMLSGLYAVSPESDDNGRFFLHLAGKSELYLQAREDVAVGVPELGSLIGAYGGEQIRRVKVEPGKRVEGVEITVAPRKAEKAAAEN